MKKIQSLVLIMLLLLTFPINGVFAQTKITDSQGRELLFDNQPEKVVVLGYSELDSLKALGLIDKIVGAPLANVPEYLGELPGSITDVGTLKEPNLETIANLEPDLIIANGRTQELVAELEKIAPVFVYSLDTTKIWESFIQLNEAFASLFQVEDQLSVALEELDGIIQDINDFNQANPSKNLVLMLNEGAMSAFSTGSRFGILFDVLGFGTVDQEIEASRHGQEISFEGILSLNPDRIFYLDRTLAVGGDSQANPVLAENALVQETTAKKNQAILPLTADLWYLSGDGLESMKVKFKEIANYIGLEID